MAVGDVVSGISADNTIVTFQPAVGVEVCITSVLTDQIASPSPQLYIVIICGSPTIQHTNDYNIKFFINNTNYLYIGALGAGYFSAYTGIQTK